MAKKNKRQVRRESFTTAGKSTTDPLASGRPSGFNPDYTFVLRDVRRVAILAASFIAALVVLSFILH